MIIPDTNLLVYAYNSRSRYHKVSRVWFEDLMRRDMTILLPWLISLSFMRLMTHRSVLEHPMRAEDCFGIVAEWYSQANVRQIDLGGGGLQIFKDLVVATQPVGNLFYDCYIAALAQEYRAAIHSNDTDFGRFPGIQLVNPLQDSVEMGR